MNMDTVRKKLEGLSVEELRKIERKLHKAVEGNYVTIGMLRQRTDEAYESCKTIGRLGHRVRWTIGKRKGIKCPALLTRKETFPETTNRERMIKEFACGCDGRDYAYYKTSYNFFHRCARCNRSKEEAYKEMVFNGVFQEKGQY